MKRLINNINKLQTDDFTLLKYLYLYRTLTIRQIQSSVYHLKKDDPKLNYKWAAILRRLQKCSVVEKCSDLTYDDVLYLTNYGVEIAKYIGDIPNEKYDDQKQRIIPGYYSASEIKLKSRFVNHQVHLNQFMLNVQKILNYYQLPFKYFDERFANDYGTMRPDALLKFLNLDFFIEEDMATETMAQLTKKWIGYREFLDSFLFRRNNRSVVVLFLCDNIKSQFKIDRRKELIRYSISQVLLDTFPKDFDILVFSPKEAYQYLIQLIQVNLQKKPNFFLFNLKKFSSQHSYQINYPEKLLLNLDNKYFAFDLRKIKNQNLVLLNNEKNPPLAEEFLVDSYFNRNLRIMSRIHQFHKILRSFVRSSHYLLMYLVVIQEGQLAQTFLDLKMSGNLDQDNVYFTTLKRLNSKEPFYKIIFKFNQDGSIYHFTNHHLDHFVPENDLDLLNRERKLIKYIAYKI